jgi:hypothetical protein
LVIILGLKSLLIHSISKKSSGFVLGGKEQRRILPIGPFESAIFWHWMAIVTDC